MARQRSVQQLGEFGACLERLRQEICSHQRPDFYRAQQYYEGTLQPAVLAIPSNSPVNVSLTIMQQQLSEFLKEVDGSMTAVRTWRFNAD